MMFPSRAAAVSLLLVAALVPALAQTAPAAAPPAPAPAPVPALPQSEVSPEKLALARTVVQASGMSRSFDPMLPQLEEQIPRVVTRARPELGSEVNIVLTQLKPEFDKKKDDMLDIAARIYARRLSEDDLKTAAAFFSSASGQRYVDAQPLMLDELVVAMQAWTQETSTYLMKRVQAEMEKRGDKF